MHRFFPSHCESTQIALYHIIKQSKFSTWLVESQAKNEIKSRFQKDFYRFLPRKRLIVIFFDSSVVRSMKMTMLCFDSFEVSTCFIKRSYVYFLLRKTYAILIPQFFNVKTIRFAKNRLTNLIFHASAAK